MVDCRQRAQGVVDPIGFQVAVGNWQCDLCAIFVRLDPNIMRLSHAYLEHGARSFVGRERNRYVLFRLHRLLECSVNLAQANIEGVKWIDQLFE